MKIPQCLCTGYIYYIYKDLATKFYDGTGYPGESLCNVCFSYLSYYSLYLTIMISQYFCRKKKKKNPI